MAEGNVAADQLRLFIERIERLEEEKKGIADDIRDVYAEAKAVGRTVVVLALLISGSISHAQDGKGPAAQLVIRAASANAGASVWFVESRFRWTFEGSLPLSRSTEE